MKITQHHNLSNQEAHTRINKFLSELQAKHSDMIRDPKKEWNKDGNIMDFSFKAVVFNISGQIFLKNKEVILEGKVPILLQNKEDEIKETIKKELEKLLS